MTESQFEHLKEVNTGFQCSYKKNHRCNQKRKASV